MNSRVTKNRWGKFLGWGVLTLLLVLAIAITFTVGWRPFVRPRHRALTSRQFESTAQRRARGEYLVRNVTGCTVCHSVRDFTKHDNPVLPGTLLAGSHIDDPGMPGAVYTPNLTPDPETAAARWSDDQLARAIREGIGHDGRALFPMMPVHELPLPVR